MTDELPGVTATDKLLRIDLRKQRAHQITSALLKALEPVLDRVDDPSGRIMRDAYDALGEIVYGDGYEIITDERRAAAGLPPRDEMGWTDAELHAYEYATLMMITHPLVMAVPLTVEPK